VRGDRVAPFEVRICLGVADDGAPSVELDRDALRGDGDDGAGVAVEDAESALRVLGEDDAIVGRELALAVLGLDTRPWPTCPRRSRTARLTYLTSTRSQPGAMTLTPRW